MSQLHTYLPQDRLRALAREKTLPDRTTGSALFADISGFTQLTEGLRNTLGPRRGTEELTRYLDTVYSALIAEIERFGGSVLGFAGDAITCWFEDAPSKAAARAVASAMAMQTAMQAFARIPLPDGTTATLTLKVAIATGSARRFIVGDPRSGLLDALAGATVTRTATAEHLATGGEILLDEATVAELGSALDIQARRKDKSSGERFAVLAGYEERVPPTAVHPPLELAPEKLQPWVLPAVYDRVQAGQSSFQTEFRPCTALFVRFVGLDYDADRAGAQLDTFIRKMQTLAERYDCTLLRLTIGDKGSYAHLNFGGLSAHEDDPRRAVKTALALQEAARRLGYLNPLQIGITQGVMRVGAYGGETRKTFGAMGDEVNLAARLMATATAGEILLSGHVQKATRSDFTFEPRPPLPMKGKAEPLPVFAVTGESQRRAVRLQEPNYSLPMVGRVEELHLIEEKLDLVAQGKSQVIGIVSEAGLGKSRLVAEVIRNARRKGFVGFGGACQSDGIHTPYLAWKSIWQAFFEIDPAMSERKLMRLLEGDIEDRAPLRVDAMPLLNVVLDLNIPENDFTKNLEPKIRQSALHALLEDCLKAQATDEPTLIVIEDMHWIDALSHNLLERFTKALAGHAVCFVLAYRPSQRERLQSPRIEAMEQFTRIELCELTTAEAESAVRAKLAQLYPARGGALPAGLVEALMARAQGNPFYLEELLNYVRDRGLDPSHIENLELPDSLHTLILSRIDQLSEGEKTTLRVASIVGRRFRAKWLTGYYPGMGSFPRVKAALDALESLDITPLDSPEPKLAYLFKHIVTHEVTYESLPFDTRARLHEQLAVYLEGADAPVETIAFHYGHSENQYKQMEYLRKAGEVSQKNYANDAALVYYGQILPLLKDRNEQAQIHLKRGQVLEFMGKWDDADGDYRAALESANDDPASKANAQLALGKLNRLRGENEAALDWLRQAKDAHAKLEDTTGLAQVLIETGLLLLRKGEYGQAREPLDEALGMAREANDKLKTALALNALGNVISDQGDTVAARTFYEESLALRREMGDKAGVAGSLNNLGIVAISQGNYAMARALYEESLALVLEIGDKRGITSALNNLGGVTYEQGDSTASQAYFEESLALKREMGDKRGMAMSLNNLGSLIQAQGDYAKARGLYGECLLLCKEMEDKPTLAYALLGLGLVDLADGKPEAHENILGSLRLRHETGEQLQQTSSLIGVAAWELKEGNAELAGRLLGAARSALKTLNAVVEPEMKPFHEQTLAKTKEALGDAGFQSAWDEGSGWSLERAVELALGEKQP